MSQGKKSAVGTRFAKNFCPRTSFPKMSASSYFNLAMITIPAVIGNNSLSGAQQLLNTTRHKNINSERRLKKRHYSSPTRQKIGAKIIRSEHRRSDRSWDTNMNYARGLLSASISPTLCVAVCFVGLDTRRLGTKREAVCGSTGVTVRSTLTLAQMALGRTTAPRWTDMRSKLVSV